MPTNLITYFCLSILLTAQSTPPSYAQTPAPQVNLQFTIPLADGSQATALLLPMPEERLLLVFATQNARLGSWMMSRTTTPTPTPIPPPNPPTPPQPTTGLALITITASEAATIPREVADRLAAARSSFFPFTVAMVSDKNPPPNALIWIGRSAGKPYPYTFLAGPDGTTLWQGPTPQTTAAFLEILKTPPAPIAAAPCGPNGCPNLPLKATQ